MIIDVISSKPLNLPDDNYPETEIVRLFLSESDARSVVERTELAAASTLKNAVLVPVPVSMLATMPAVAAKRKAAENIGYVIHGTNEVDDFL